MSASSMFIVVLLPLFAALSQGAGATSFSVTNQCNFVVWPALSDQQEGGGTQLNPGETWNLELFPPVTNNGAMAIWPRTGCDFNDAGSGSCATGDCDGRLSCSPFFSFLHSPAATLAGFFLDDRSNTDFYDIDVINGFNVAMDFSCSTGVTIRCRDAGCPEAYQQPDDAKTQSCSGDNRSFRIVFCP
ncbi:thaumatin-like pathogenesis-related protein 4 [Brachypodium distachyon]|uniref:Thaumatin-like protein n=1 Tax=Brachypodium distachyon TaxID=15368 RepID=I1IH17_BRADI|nr:thaumatin-like pathogenesis-related protein 4 [Brachypodium distachyon]KQJ86095.1 hypothetical protein BRADI_4g03280v3 [Brachypodium distachyon]|eukprot:XP_003578312.1 thaumatin-like pathogenesis-related protein 4 [Brachypodium distachyon]